MKLLLGACALVAIPVSCFVYEANYSADAVTRKLLDRLAAASDADVVRIVRTERDGWGTFVRFDVVGGRWVFRSAGPDVRFGTADDVVKAGRKYLGAGRPGGLDPMLP